MPDPESIGETTPEQEEAAPGILETVKSAIGLGAAEDTDSAAETPEPEAAPVSAKTKARDNYRQCAGRNAAAKQARKEKLSK